ncbi:MAG: hypothetical protein O6838_05370, partial [Gammaproteobacteria bacterium]|nr:hypothetical protein [Gammaproteobacteria bacterium]
MKCRLIIISTLLVAAVGNANASTVEDFFRNREISDVQLSPDGEYLTALVRTEKNPGGTDLMVMNLATGKSEAITFARAADIIWYYWAGEDRIVFSLYGAAFHRTLYKGVFSISPDGKDRRNLYGSGVGGTKYRLIPFFRLPNDDDHILLQ